MNGLPYACTGPLVTMAPSGITDEDRERIRTYLERPAEARRIQDLIPDEESGDD